MEPLPQLRPDEWRNLEGNYLVSEAGGIKNLNTGVVLKSSQHRNGHLYVFIYVNGKRKKVYVHRAVALAFIPKEPRKPLVDHIDGDKTHNHRRNLRWISAASNTRHAVKLGTHVTGRPTRAVIATSRYGRSTFHFASMRQAEKHFAGKSTGVICRAIAKGRMAYGYWWHFYE